MLVELARYASSMEAAIVVGRLEAEGVDAVAFDGGMNIADSSGWLVPVRVMVLDEDLEFARGTLAAFHAEPAAGSTSTSGMAYPAR